LTVAVVSAERLVRELVQRLNAIAEPTITLRLDPIRWDDIEDIT